MESREGVQQIALIELQRVVAADQEFRRSDDVFAVDNAEKAHLWMADEIIEDSGHHHGVTRVQHIVETNDAVKMQNRVDEFQVVGQASARVVAVDMNEPHGSLAKLVSQVARRDFAAVRLPAKEAVTRDSVGRAIGEKSTFDAAVGPIEPINAEGFFTDYQSERHSDKEATFESTDLDEIPGNGEFRLAPDEVPADSGGEAGGHAAHLLVAFGKVAINGWMTARDLDRSFETCCHVPFPKFLKRYLVGACTGKSEGFSPLRMRSM